MKAILIGVCLMLSASMGQASGWKLVPYESEELVFVDEDRMSTVGAMQRLWVLRSYPKSFSLGGWYEHRSQKLQYFVDCQTDRLALTSWEFYEGTLGHGRTVWTDAMPSVEFITPARASVDERIIGIACVNQA